MRNREMEKKKNLFGKSHLSSTGNAIKSESKPVRGNSRGTILTIREYRIIGTDGSLIRGIKSKGIWNN